MGLGGLGIPGILIIALILLVFFGRGKIPQLMGDVAKGVTAFRKGLKDEPEAGAEAGAAEPKTIDATAEKTAADATAEKAKSEA